MKALGIMVLEICLIILGLFGFSIIIDHCQYYSVYYTQHMSESNSDKVAKVLIRNLDHIERPDQGYRYDFDGSKVAKKIDPDSGESVLILSTDGSGFYCLDDEGNSYYLDTDLRLIKYYNVSSDIWVEGKDIDDRVEKKLKLEIHDLIQPIVDIQPEPEVKFQWIFNLYYWRLDAKYSD